MTTTLSIPVEKGIAERIKQYADSHKTTVSRITENFFSIITIPVINAKTTNVSPLVQSFSIDGVNVPADFDYKKTLAEARNKKYL